MLFKKKAILICIHGFGKRRTIEMQPAKEFFTKQGFEVFVPELFDSSDETDIAWAKWVARAKDVTETYIKQKRDVYVMGFSMGGVIASYLASTLPIKKVILLAPAYEYLTVQTVKKAINSFKEPKKGEIISEFIELPNSFYGTFTEVIDTLKPYVSSIKCPVLMIHGTDDEVIPVSVSKKYFPKIPVNLKSLVYLEGSPHRILDDPINGKIALHLSLDFMKSKIIS